MADRPYDVHVQGLTEAVRALTSLDDILAHQLLDADRAAVDLVAADARSQGASLGGVAAKAAPSVRADLAGGLAVVGFGGPGYEFAAGAEFGGRGRPTTQQFQPWRGPADTGGYFVYPTIRADADRIDSVYGDAADAAIRKADLD